MDFISNDAYSTRHVCVKMGNERLKTFHFIRHAEGEHNVVGELDHRNYLLPEYEDAVLSRKGLDQCNALASEVSRSENFKHIDLILVSPLRRTLQTATLTFPSFINKVPWYGIDSIREVTGMHPCDRRLPVSTTSKEFPHVSFEFITANEDPLYHLYKNSREPEEKVVERCEEFMRWVFQRDEQDILVITHSAFLRTLSRVLLRIRHDNQYENAEIRSYLVKPCRPIPFSVRVNSFRKVKVLHLLRHAEAEHNALGIPDSEAALFPELEDALVTDTGMQQCLDLAEALSASGMLRHVDLVVTSPHRRTLQTATASLPFLMSRVPWYAHETVREVTGGRPWNKRIPVSATSPSFPHVSFEHMSSDEDAHYHLYDKREPEEKVVERCQEFMRWVFQREEKEIVVVSHGAFLRTLSLKILKGDSVFSPKFENAELKTYYIGVST